MGIGSRAKTLCSMGNLKTLTELLSSQAPWLHLEILSLPGLVAVKPAKSEEMPVCMCIWTLGTGGPLQPQDIMTPMASRLSHSRGQLSQGGEHADSASIGNKMSGPPECWAALEKGESISVGIQESVLDRVACETGGTGAVAGGLGRGRMGVKGGGTAGHTSTDLGRQVASRHPSTVLSPWALPPQEATGRAGPATGALLGFQAAQPRSASFSSRKPGTQAESHCPHQQVRWDSSMGPKASLSLKRGDWKPSLPQPHCTLRGGRTGYRTEEARLDHFYPALPPEMFTGQVSPQPGSPTAYCPVGSS
ncbi:hypothetical protein Cadr_000020179 [Camelus dromedarius]|uniref:Uncharacterized protein n=1 Tax=Camelus dromedarius TaxID=9838 RepID=A0A5N4D0T6_CAMDR|nr:hypothetical protein Cadr_000020179 [Camelus dromedarius]